MSYQNKTGTLSQGAHPGSYNGQDAYNDMFITEKERESMGNRQRADEPIEAATDSRNSELYARSTDSVDYVVRRLTPTECARLQGFPDWWCSDIPHTDSAEYKMWGNGVALPCVLYVMEGIRKALDE